jgi:CheY-like chemotaxis protein
MGGRIWATSTPGEGSVFTFTMSAEVVSSAPTETLDAMTTPPDLTGRQILLAEDIPVNREIVLAVMEPTHAHIVEAENGRVALDLFAQRPEAYDLILMDVQMPEMDGYAATRAIRALDAPTAKIVPIIAMTANVFKQDIENCLAAGMNSHVGKPINTGELMSKLRQALGIRT